MFDGQNEKLDEIGGIVKAMRHENENIHDEVVMQNKMLDKLGNEIEETNNKMIRIDSKLKRLIAKSKTCCLWIIIIIEIIAWIACFFIP